MILEDTIREVVEMSGVDFFGVADLSLAHDAILKQGGPIVASYPRAITIGIALLHSIVDQLPQRAEHAVAVSYRHSYELTNQRLDLIASQLGCLLQRSGYRVLPIPSAKRVDDERICASFSHKMAAHLAGLGWIGKSCLLITPQVGPRVRWVSVLTNALLEVTGGPTKEQCGSCQECVEICPVQAFTGRPFREEEPREVRYDASKCDRYFANMKEEKGDLAVCGLCLYVCPYGKGRENT